MSAAPEELAAREAVGVEEAARLAGIGRTKMFSLLGEGKGPVSFKLGRRRLIRVEALREWLADLEARQNGGEGGTGRPGAER